MFIFLMIDMRYTFYFFKRINTLPAGRRNSKVVTGHNDPHANKA